MNKITTYENADITGILAKARDNSVTRVLENQLLDGTFNVQTVGAPATRISVEFYCAVAVRRVLQDYSAAATLIKVWWGDMVWTGYISGGKLSWDLFAGDLNRVTFDLLVIVGELQ